MNPTKEELLVLYDEYQRRLSRVDGQIATINYSINAMNDFNIDKVSLDCGGDVPMDTLHQKDLDELSRSIVEKLKAQRAKEIETRKGYMSRLEMISDMLRTMGHQPDANWPEVDGVSKTKPEII